MKLQSLAQIAANYLPSDAAERGESWVLRAKLWMIVALLSVLVALVTGIDHLVRGPRIWGVVLLVGGAAILSMFRVLRRTGRLEFVGNYVSAMWFLGLLVAIYIRGGAGAPGMLMAGIVPMLTVLYAGWRSGVVWIAIVLVAQASFTIIYALGYRFPVRVSEESQHFSDTTLSFVRTMVLAFVALGYEWYRVSSARARREADRVRQEAEYEVRFARADRLASIGQISAGVAHEINNPLAYIAGNLDFLRDALSEPEYEDPEWTSELQEAIGDALDGARRIQQIVRDLNTYTRDEEEEVRVFELQSAVQAAVKMIENEIRHRATLVLELGEPVSVSGDPSRFTQIFLNVLINASQSLGSDQSQDKRITVSMKRTDERVTVLIADTGIGISPENLHRATDPFFTTKTVGEGTGLGLSVSRNLAERYGGEIKLSSEPGVGTTVALSWPMAAPACAPSVRDLRAPERTGFRVLVVDDDELIRRTLSRMLKNHTIDLAASGAEALEILASEHAYDVILCDLMMPGKTGIDVYREVLDRDPELARRFVFISGGVFGEEIERQVAALDRAVLPKPIDRKQLSEALEAIASAS